MDAWTFIWLMVILKIPIVALFLIVRWAVRQTPEAAPEEDGGIGPRLASAPPAPPALTAAALAPARPARRSAGLLARADAHPDARARTAAGRRALPR